MSLRRSIGPLRSIAISSELPPIRSLRRRDEGRSLAFEDLLAAAPIRNLFDEWRFVPEVESMSRSLFSACAGRLSLWLGGAALAFLAFVRITREFIEGDVGALDNAILLAMEKTRTPWLTVSAIDVTALRIDHLGSIVFGICPRGVACVTRPTGCLPGQKMSYGPHTNSDQDISFRSGFN